MKSLNKQPYYIFVIALEDEVDKEVFIKYPDNILLTGVGKVNAVMSLTKFLSTNLILKKYKNVNIINVGTAGLVNNISPYTEPFLICDKCYFHDVNLTAFGYKLGQLAGKNSLKYYPTDVKLNAEIIKCLDKLFFKHYKVNIATGDSFIQKNDNILNIISKIDPTIKIIDMEATALAHVCNQFNVPFSSIKVISDVVDNYDNMKQYNDFCEQKRVNILEIMNYFLI